MSSSRRSAAGSTRSALPEERSSMTVTLRPSARSASTTCEPMNPAPPVTIARLLTRGNLYGGRGGGACEQSFDGFDRLVDPLEDAHIAPFAGQAPTDGGASEDDRHVRVA